MGGGGRQGQVGSRWRGAPRAAAAVAAAGSRLRASRPGARLVRQPVVQQLVEVAGEVGVKALVAADELVGEGEAFKGGEGRGEGALVSSLEKVRPVVHRGGERDVSIGGRSVATGRGAVG